MKLKIADLSETQLKDYLITCSRIKELSDDRLGLALKKYAASTGAGTEEIRRLLVESHLKLAVSIAARYRGAGLSFASLIAHGNNALIASVKKWDFSKNSEFVSYLAWNIEGAMLDALIKVKKGVSSPSQNGRFSGQG